jgi:Ca-activated chloride channel family protein
MTMPEDPRPNPVPVPDATPPAAPGATLRVRTDRRLIRASARSERYLLVDVVAPTVARDPARRRPPVNLAFVVDRSGSMSGHAKLTLAKQAVLESIHRLDDEDRFAVVVYDSEIDVVLPGTHAAETARRTAADRLRHVEPRGSTALHGGWVTGCNEVAGGLGEGVNRVLLLTDGLANVGVQDPDELARQAADLRARGITTSTFGVGRDFDEQLLQGMADSGGGNFYFIGDVAQMRDHITSEVGDTLEVVARDVVLELDVPAGAMVRALSAFRLEQAGSRVHVHLGDLVSGQVVQVALAVRFDLGFLDSAVQAVVRIDDRAHVLASAGQGAEPVTVTWTYADHERNDAQPRDGDVDRFVARMTAERSRVEASRLNKQGRYREAREELAMASAFIAPLAASDAMVASLRMEVDADADAFSAPMDAYELKRRHFAAVSGTKARRTDGKPMRPGDLPEQGNGNA